VMDSFSDMGDTSVQETWVWQQKARLERAFCRKGY
jgi:hypothetical protein